jgi:hypothetical protein
LNLATPGALDKHSDSAHPHELLTSALRNKPLQNLLRSRNLHHDQEPHLVSAVTSLDNENRHPELRSAGPSIEILLSLDSKAIQVHPDSPPPIRSLNFACRGTLQQVSTSGLRAAPARGNARACPLGLEKLSSRCETAEDPLNIASSTQRQHDSCAVQMAAENTLDADESGPNTLELPNGLKSSIRSLDGDGGPSSLQPSQELLAPPNSLQDQHSVFNARVTLSPLAGADSGAGTGPCEPALGIRQHAA